MSETAATESIKVENVVASTDLGTEIDLESLVTEIPGAEYDPNNFPGLVYRIMEPKMATLIFESGKIVCTGANSVEAVEKGLETVLEKFRELGVDIKENPELSIQNIVSSADMGDVLNLNALAIGLGLETVEYEPEQFPGLVYRLDDLNVVVLLFGSGKVVITGGKSEKDAERAVQKVRADLDELNL